MSLAKRAAMKRYYAAHRDELKASRRAWYEANAAREKGKSLARYKQIKEAVLSYTTNDPESLFAAAQKEATRKGRGGP